jgi:hypothetical protein
MGKLIGAGIFVVVLLSIVIWYMSTSNREVRLRNQFNAQVKANQVNYDNLWKTISQKYQLSTEYKNGMVEVIKAIAEGRQGGSLFKTVQEAMPGFDASIIKDVMATVEGKRNMFEAQQKKLIDIKREHDDMRTVRPASWICSGRPELELKLVTSGRTNDAFDNGEDNDVSLSGAKPTTQKK